MNIGKAFSHLFASSGITKVIYFGATAYFAARYGPEQIGSFYLFESFLIFSSLFSDFGINGSIKKRISEVGKSSGPLSAGLLMKTTTLLLTLGASVILQDRVVDYIGHSKFRIVLFAVIAFNIKEVVKFVLQGEKKIGKSANVELINRSAWGIFGFIFAISGWRISAIFISYVIGLSLSTIYGIIYTSTRLQLPNKSSFRSIIDYAKYNAISSLSGFSFGWLDVAMLGILLGPAAVGLYETAWRVTGVLSLLSVSLANTLFPAISEKSSLGDLSKIGSLISDALFASLYIAIPGSLGLILLSEEILLVVFGADYTDAAILLSVLSLHKVLLAINSICGQGLHAIDLPNKASLASVIGTIANLGLNYGLILRFGAVGAAVATVTAYTINTGLHYYYLRREIPIRFIRSQFWLLPFSTVIVVIVYLCSYLFSQRSIVGLFITIIITAVVYFGITLGTDRIRLRLKNLWANDL